MNPAVMKAFMASVGFQADEKSLKAALARVAAFGAAIKLATAAVYAATLRAAQGEAELARRAEQLGTTTERLREMEYAAADSGVSLDQVADAMETLVRKNPRIKDGAKALELAAARMKGLSLEQRRIYAQKLGLDPKLIHMLSSDLAGLRAEFKGFYAASGLDGKRSAEASKGLTAEWGKLLLVGKLLTQSALLPFMERLRIKSQELRKWLEANGERVRAVIGTAIGIFNRLSEVISRMVSRVGQALSWLAKKYESLGEQSKNFVKAMAILAGGMALLFAPALGLAALIGVVLLLLEDFVTWSDGGESYFDWQWLQDLINWFRDLDKALDNLAETLLDLLPDWLKDWLDKGKAEITAARAEGTWDPWGGDLAFAGLTPQAAASGAATAGGGNVTLHAQTDIHIQSTDPLAAGRQAEAAQGRLNADLARNMRAAAR